MNRQIQNFHAATYRKMLCSSYSELFQASIGTLHTPSGAVSAATEQRGQRFLGDADDIRRRAANSSMTNKNWSVTKSQNIARNRWISVRSDDCMTASGTKIDAYYLIESQDFVHMLAFDTSHRAILVRQYRHGYGAQTLELPGGIMDEQETDITIAAARELREETGFSGGCLQHIITLSPDPGRYTNRVHLVLAEGVIPGTAAPEPTEDIETVLVPRDDLAALACSGSITNAAHVGFILLALARTAGTCA